MRKYISNVLGKIDCIIPGAMREKQNILKIKNLLLALLYKSVS